MYCEKGKLYITNISISSFGKPMYYNLSFINIVPKQKQERLFLIICFNF